MNRRPLGVSRRLAGALALAGVCLVVAAPAARAQSVKAADADMRELASYRLTTANFNRYVQAMRNIAAVAKSNPQVVKEFAAGKPEGNNASLASMSRMYDRVPQMKGAITKTGLSTHEFAVLQMSLFQAGMASAVMKMNGEKLPEGTPRENVVWMREHQSDFEKLQAEFKAMEKDMKPAGESGDGDEAASDETEGDGTP